MKAVKEILLLSNEKIIFLLSAKCASSAVRRMAINQLGYGDDLTYLQPEEVKNYKHFYKVMLVRNPYDRMVSLYKDKVVRVRYHHFRTLGIVRGCSFVDFLKVLVVIPDDGERSEGHFWSQTIFYDQVSPNLVIKLEEIEQHWFTLGLPELQVENASKDTTPYPDFYDSEAIALVKERYERDLQLLQYDFNYAYSG
jgi:hypothetical protein